MPPTSFWTRIATSKDAAAIAAIYNDGIADRIATFDTEPPTPEQIAKQLLDNGDRFPTIVPTASSKGKWRDCVIVEGVLDEDAATRPR